MLKNIFFYLLDYLKFFFKSTGAYGIHSPFVFDLYTEVIIPYKHYYFFEEMNRIKSKLSKNNDIIITTDFGAGSKIFSNNKRKIKNILKYSVSKSKKSQLIFKLIDYFKPITALELGTSLGINTLYMVHASQKTNVISLEGCKNTIEIARELINQYSTNIKIIEGKIENTLPQVLKGLSVLDFVFFDANHTYKATLNYFEQCLVKVRKQTIFVIDDIYWSVEMKKVWQQIKRCREVSLTIDLFDMGLVFFRKNQVKEHFFLRY